MKKVIYILLLLTTIIGISGCQSQGFISDSKITVISREDGSGTRGAFTHLLGIYDKDKVDNTTIDADVFQSTGAILSSVSANKYAIGYVSYGVLNHDVKALEIDHIAISKETIKNNSYKISRSFGLVSHKNNQNLVAQDFIQFILSQQGQQIIEHAKYMAVDQPVAFNSTSPKGKVTISGSSSVAPVIEKLKEAYLKINPHASIEINQSDSTSGVENALQQISDIGMISRDLTDKEKSQPLQSTTIAIDALAIIVNTDNPIHNLSQQQIRDIYQGQITNWQDLKEK